jgi:hypothetical protein
MLNEAEKLMDEAEKRFRDAERQLDELLRRDEAVIAARGIIIADESSRAYSKNDHLSWSYRFETRRARGSEVEKVWVLVSLFEHDPASLRVWRRAEIFQVGQVSRWQSTTEEVLPLGEVARGGLSDIVLEAISAGESAAAAAA